MRNISRLLAVGMLALLIAAPTASAQIPVSPEVSTLQVDEPLDVGGTILQPGTYTIRVAPNLGDRNRVQVLSPDLKTIYTTVLTVPHDLEPNEDDSSTTFVFYPAGEGQPRALRTWFAPNSAMEAGHDIVYEETRAKQLARLASAPVVAYRGEIVDNTPLEVVTPTATIEVYTPPAPMAPAPLEPAPMMSSPRAPEMPETAGNVPLIALFGLLSLGAAVVFRLVRQA